MIRLSDILTRLDPPRCAVPDRLVRRIPWVHRTCRPGRPRWKDLWAEGRLRAQDASCEPERVRGHSPVVYLSLGYAAYPHGLLALLIAPDADELGGTATPFDSGGVLTGRMLLDGTPLTADDAVRFWESWLLPLAEVRALCAAWIASHFSEPNAYLALPSDSDPDLPARHGLVALPPLGRLAWTIEGQVAADVPLDLVREVICARRALIWKLPAAYRANASYPPDEEAYTEASFDRYIAVRVRERMEAA